MCACALPLRASGCALFRSWLVVCCCCCRQSGEDPIDEIRQERKGSKQGRSRYVAAVHRSFFFFVCTCVRVVCPSLLSLSLSSLPLPLPLPLSLSPSPPPALPLSLSPSPPSTPCSRSLLDPRQYLSSCAAHTPSAGYLGCHRLNAQPAGPASAPLQ